MRDITKVKCFLFDLDGTVYTGDKIIPGAAAVFDALTAAGKNYCYLTNNSSLSTEGYVAKLVSKGLNANSGNVITSGWVAARYIADNYADKKVFALVTDSYASELKNHGIKLTTCADFDNGNYADLVLLGYDTCLEYQKLWRACVLIRRGASYIATHHDINCPSEYGGLPDAGSFMAMIEASTGRACQTICGKPFAIMANEVMRKFNLLPHEIAMVGDRLYTDIAFGVNNGFVSILVLSGETDRQMLELSDISPDYVFADITEIAKHL